MANGEVQGGGGGGQTYSEEDVMALMNEAARRAASEAMKSAQMQNAEQLAQMQNAQMQQMQMQHNAQMQNAQRMNEEEEDGSIINPKVVKQLKDTVAVFTALKDLSSNPLQKTIEETVGGMAASVVQSAFSPRGPPPRQDIVEKLLNSQFAYGLGNGLGQRAPELVETMGRTFGTEKASQMMDNIIGKYGGGGGGQQSRQIAQPPSSSSSSGHSGNPSGSSSSTAESEQKTDKQSEKELLLSLDPNNPEHVSAYAETQGGLPVDVARKMLMIHQDAFIEQLKRDGMNVDQISTQRGSHTQVPTQQSSQQSQRVPPSNTPPIPPTNISGGYGPESQSQSNPQSDTIEYTDFQDVENQPQQHQQQKPDNVDSQQAEMMKTFATDIGKVMGDMLNKIESLNNTVFTLQSEMNDIKRQGPKQQINTEMPPRVSPNIVKDITNENVSLEEMAEKSIEKSGDFFEEDVIDISNFKQELENDVSTPVPPIEKITPPATATPNNPIVPSIINNPIVPPIIRTIYPVSPPSAQPIPPVQTMPPQPIPMPAQPVPSIQSQPVQIPQQISPPDMRIVQINQEENNIENEKELDKSKELNELDKSNESNELKELKTNKISEEISEKTIDNNLVIPTNEESKKVGVHKKAAFRNIKPSFKKNDGENKI